MDMLEEGTEKMEFMPVGDELKNDVQGVGEDGVERGVVRLGSRGRGRVGRWGLVSRRLRG